MMSRAASKSQEARDNSGSRDVLSGVQKVLNARISCIVLLWARFGHGRRQSFCLNRKATHPALRLQSRTELALQPSTRFDPQEQCWHALGGAALPHPRWGSAVALDAEGRLFVCGGYKDGRSNVRKRAATCGEMAFCKCLGASCEPSRGSAGPPSAPQGLANWAVPCRANSLSLIHDSLVMATSAAISRGCCLVLALVAAPPLFVYLASCGTSAAI